MKRGDPEQFSNPDNRKRFTLITVGLGLAFLIDAIIHITMALTLSTVSYMAMSRVITILVILCIVFGVKWLARNRQ